MENKKCIIIITGASRGLGRSFGIELAKHVGQGSVFVLMARGLPGLNETKDLILKEAPKNVDDVACIPMDNSKPNESEFRKAFEENLGKMKRQATDFDLALIIHNAGSLGNQGTFTRDFVNLDEMQNYFSLNLYSTMILNSVFMKQFDKTKQKIVINITSLCGSKPYKSFGSYCTGKAARDMFFKVVAEEEQENNTKVLSYSPGPVDTEMVSGIIHGDQTSDEMRAGFKGMKENGKLLKPHQPAEKLIKIILEDSFENGQIIDFFDRM